MLNRLVEAANLPGWQAGDIGASAMLRDHRIVWVFGDTIRSPGRSPRLVANSLLVRTGVCASVLTTPAGGAFIPDRADGVVYWPMSVVYWPMSVVVLPQSERDLLVVFASRVRRGTGGGLDFTHLGTSAVVFSVAPGDVPAFVGESLLTPDSVDQTAVNWGAAAMVSDGWIYVYGTRLTGTAGVFGHELFVGRGAIDAPQDRRRWQFWDGATWQIDPAHARAILPAVGGVSQTLSVDRVGDSYVAVSKRDGDLGDMVYTWSAAGPNGPWTARAGVPAPTDLNRDLLRYAPLAHPEIPLESGRLLVSVSRTTTSLTRLLSEPEQSRPYFVELDPPAPR